MRSVFIAHNYKDESYNIMSYSLAHHLCDKGYRVVFISHNPHFSDLEYVRHDKGELIICSWNSSQRPTQLKDLIWFTKLFIRYRPFCIVGHFVGANISAVLSKLLSFGKARTLVYYHTLSRQLEIDNEQERLRSKFKYYRKRFFYLFFCDLIITPSKMGQVDLQNYFGIKKSEVVPSPMKDRFKEYPKLSSSKIILAFLGRLDKSKGILEFIEALIHYKKENKLSKIELKIAGSGPLSAYLKELSEKFDFIHFYGSLDYKEVDKYLSSSHYALIPSVLDNFNSVALESLMNGVPVTISTGTGISEYLIDGNECYKFKFDKAEMIATLTRIESNFNEQMQMSIMARETYLRMFTLSGYCNKMVELIE